MSPERKAATTVGALYIVGTVAGVLSAVVTGPLLNDPGDLGKVAAHENQLMVGALLVLTMGLALALIPVVMFPLAKQHDEALAVGYVVFRGALETITYLLLVVSWFFLIALSRAYVQAGTSDASSWQTLATAWREGADQIVASTAIVFSLGALMFYALLYRSQLIPRWLSGWGLIAAVAYLAAGVYNLFASELVFLLLPMVVQEMVMAVWLMVKGFNPAAIAAGSARVAMNAGGSGGGQKVAFVEAKAAV